MISRLRRLAVVAVAASLLGAKVAWAFIVPLLPGVGLWFTSGTMAASYGAAVGFVGSILMILSIGSPETDGAGNVGGAVGAIEVRLTPEQSARTPPGWSASSVAGADPVPPSVAAVPGINAVTAETWTWQIFDSCLGPAVGGTTSYSSTSAAMIGLAQRVNGDSYCTGNNTLLWSPCFVAGKDSLCEHGSTSWPITTSFPGTKIDFASRDSMGTGGGQCPTGYSGGGDGSCTLTAGADTIKFPVDGGCGIKKSNGVWLKDMRDPDCSRQSNVSFSSRRVKVTDSVNKRYVYVDAMDDGTTRVTEVVDNNDNTSTKSEYNVNAAGKFTGANQSQVYGSGSTAGAPTLPSGSVTVPGSGTGSDPGTGNEQGGGSCGGAGQPACAIDDSGFSGKDANGQGAVDAFGTYATGRESQMEAAKDAPAYGVSWVPSLFPGPSTACRPITLNFAIDRGPLGGFSQAETFDLCEQLSFAQQILGWFFFISTVFFVVRSFFGANKGEN